MATGVCTPILELLPFKRLLPRPKPADSDATAKAADEPVPVTEVKEVSSAHEATIHDGTGSKTGKDQREGETNTDTGNGGKDGVDQGAAADSAAEDGQTLHKSGADVAIKTNHGTIRISADEHITAKGRTFSNKLEVHSLSSIKIDGNVGTVEMDLVGTEIASRASSVVISVAETSCWFQARERLMVEDNGLWLDFVKAVTETSKIDITNDLETRPLADIMRDVVDLQIQRIHSRAWTVQLPFRFNPTKVRRIIQRIVDFAKKTKPSWSYLGAVDPLLAGLPLAGLAVLVELIGNDKSEHEALLEGVDLIVDFVLIYWEIERRVVTSKLAKLLARFKEILTELYVSILRFLSKACTVLHQNTARRTAANILKWHEWASQIEEIKQQHQRCKDLANYPVMAAESEEIKGLIQKAIDEGFEHAKQAIKDMRNQFSKEEEKIREILEWISDVDVQSAHQAVREQMGERYAQNGTWLRKRVSTWLESEEPVYLLTGSVGTGKSSLVSSIIEMLHDLDKDDSTARHLYFYCVRDKTGTALGVLRSLVAQLSWSADGCSLVEPICARYERTRKESPSGTSRRLTEEDCSQLISEELSHGFRNIRIVIDALDECENSYALLSCLRDIHTKAPDSCRIKLLLSTRKGVDFPKDFPRYHKLDLDESRHLTRDDLVHFITTEVTQREKLNLGPRLPQDTRFDLEERLVNALVNGAQGTFQWAKLHLAVFFNDRSAKMFQIAKDVETRIKTLESGDTNVSRLPDLDDAYDHVYNSNTDPELGPWAATYAKRAYRVVMAAKVDIRVDALVAAVRYMERKHPLEGDEYEHRDGDNCAGEEQDSDTDESLWEMTEDDNVDAERLQSICSNLLVFSSDGTVRFAHVSVRDYLLRRPGGEYAMEVCHAQMAACCLRRLVSHLTPRPDAVKRSLGNNEAEFISSETASMNSTQPFNSSLSNAARSLSMGEDDFLVYAMVFWADHFAEASTYRGTRMLTRPLRAFFGDPASPDPGDRPLMAWLEKLDIFTLFSDRIRAAVARPSSPLVLACIWGVTEVFEYLSGKEMAQAGNFRTKEGNPLIVLAAKYQMLPIPVMEKLLSFGCLVDSRNSRTMRTALWEATSAGNRQGLQFLLDHGADLYVRDMEGQSILCASAVHCDPATVKFILLRWMHSKDPDNQAEIYEAFVRACRRTDDASGSVMYQFLRQQPGLIGEKLDSQSSHGQYPVLEAVRAKNKGALTHLLHRSASPNIIDGAGDVPLQVCAALGDTFMAEKLVAGKNGACVNFEGGAYGSAIHAAIEKNQLAMLEFLTSDAVKGDLGMNPTPSKGKKPLGPPLFYALSVGREEIALWLLGASWEPTSGSMLFQPPRRGVDVNGKVASDIFRHPNDLCDIFPSPQTPLQVAIWKKSGLKVVQRLLECGARTCRPDGCKNLCSDLGKFTTEGEMAARVANLPALDELLHTGRLHEINWPGYTWGTLLQTAVESLLHNPVPSRRDTIKLVELLLRRGADVNKTDNERLKHSTTALNSALEAAACKGIVEIVQMFLRHNALLESPDTRYGSAIAAAAAGIATAPLIRQRWDGGEEWRDCTDLVSIVTLLLNTGGANINALGKAQMTPLDWAICARAERLGNTTLERPNMEAFLEVHGAKTVAELEASRRRAGEPGSLNPQRRATITETQAAATGTDVIEPLRVHHTWPLSTEEASRRSPLETFTTNRVARDTTTTAGGRGSSSRGRDGRHRQTVRRAQQESDRESRRWSVTLPQDTGRRIYRQRTPVEVEKNVGRGCGCCSVM